MAWSAGGGIEGTVVVVTGAARGIGRAVAEAFGAAGAHVVAVDLDASGLEETRAGLPGGDAMHVALSGDLGDLTFHQSIFDEALERFGRFDHLAHVAAVLRRRADIDEITEDDWDFQVDINLKATFFLMRSAADRIASTIAAREHHRVHVTGLDDRWLRWLGRLRRDEGRHRVDVEGDGEDVRQGRDPGEHGVARRSSTRR